MVAQTTINGAARHGSAAARARYSATAVARDLWSLAELQSQLMAADFRESRRRAMAALVASVIGLVILLAAMPIALVALAELLRMAGLSAPAGYGCAALAAVVIAGGALWFAWRRLNAALTSFSRSRDELRRNLNAIRCALSSCDEPTGGD